jgi:hypothetical protein
MTTLADHLKNNKATGHRLVELFCRPSNNLGSITLTTSIDVGTFLSQSLVGNDAAAGHVTQRPLNMVHATGMASFNLSALINYTAKEVEGNDEIVPDEVLEVFAHLSPKSYYAWAPLVCSVRTDFSQVLAERLHTGEYSVKLRPDQILWVVDGQHRRKGLELTRDWLSKITTERKYPRLKDAFPVGLKVVGDEALVFWRKALELFTGDFSITTEVHFGMSIDQERQLFYFLNDLSRSVPSAVSQAFDQDNAINLFTRSIVKDVIPQGLVSDSTKQVNWDDKEWLRLDSVNGINARLLLNRSGYSDAVKGSVVNPRLPDATEFWKAVMSIPNVTSRSLSLAAQPAMLKSMAKCYYDLKWARGSGRKSLPADSAEKFLAALPTLDFGHANQTWRGDTGKNLGSVYPDGTFRYAPTHNEIVPILAALLRSATGV